MTIEEAKKIAIADYLASNGIFPTKQQNNNLWYLSPLREEKEPSFKVNLHLNMWIDFGTGEKGDIINLVQKLQRTDSVSYALKEIEEKLPHIAPNSFSFRKQTSFQSLEGITIKPLTNIALIKLLDERKIPKDIAEHYCKEVYYKCNDKHYFAIAFANEQGGYETLNKYFKGCISPKGITAIENENSSCCVFEGFVDFLSYIVLKTQQNPEQVKLKDYFILNSVNNLSKLLDRLNKYEQIYCFLDNDDAGKMALNKISQQYGLKVFDQSKHYKEHNDLNDYLTGKKLIPKCKPVHKMRM